MDATDPSHTVPGPAETPAPWCPAGSRTVTTFTATIEETAELYADLCRGSADFAEQCRQERRQRANAVAVRWLIAGLVLVWAQAALLRWPRFSTPLLVAVPAVGGTLAHIAFRASPRSYAERRAYSQGWALARKHGWQALGECRLGLCDEGVWVETPRGVTLCRWHGLMACEARPSGAVLRTARTAALLVPARALGGDAGVRALVGEITSRQRDAGADPLTIAANLLTNVAAACPACGYDLRGSGSDRCPECGATFDLELVRRAVWRKLNLGSGSPPGRSPVAQSAPPAAGAPTPGVTGPGHAA